MKLSTMIESTCCGAMADKPELILRAKQLEELLDEVIHAADSAHFKLLRDELDGAEKWLVVIDEIAQGIDEDKLLKDS